jgi:ribose transport system substrate-binding protein
LEVGSGTTFMENFSVVVALITRDNDYQAEQADAAIETASRVGAKIQVIYADNDAVNQTQQLVKIIQDPAQHPTAIIVEPVGTSMIQVAKAALKAGIGWAVLNRAAEYMPELRAGERVPVFSVTTDQEEVGRIQGNQIAALLSEGNILYIQGPYSSAAGKLREQGMLATKPTGVEVKVIKGDWTERSAYQSIKSWLALSTSRQLHIRGVVAQNDAMAMGARKALLELSGTEREYWLSVPFTGCDGVPKTGQDWVSRGLLTATVVIPATSGPAIEVLAKAIRTGSVPPECTMSAPRSFPKLDELSAKNFKRAPVASPGRVGGEPPTPRSHS